MPCGGAKAPRPLPHDVPSVVTGGGDLLEVVDRASRPASGELAQSTHAAMITARHVTKTFIPRPERYSSIKDLVLRPRSNRSCSRIEALRNVSLDIASGEVFGIVGRNGSGKSTLLRCLAGIYPIDGGELEVAGRVAPFIELGVGFNPDLTARDNVVINSVMLGTSPRDARRRVDVIIDFAGLHASAGLKLKNYSSGMIVRLAFSITVHVNADVLLFDEVLAVGDAAFQRKCFELFEQMKAGGTTILLVTHDMSLVKRFCDRAVLLEGGEIAELGDPVKVACRYAELNATSGAETSDVGDPQEDGA
jgi:ABC-type polysaccharide/polyol phosphate transport system ATPase subunit